MDDFDLHKLPSILLVPTRTETNFDGKRVNQESAQESQWQAYPESPEHKETLRQARDLPVTARLPQMGQPAHNIRRLAAIDIVFLGYNLIFAEYLFGVVGSLGLGVFVLFRSHSVSQIALGGYLISLGINYAPMLAYAVSIASEENARTELGDELIEQRKAMSKYRRISLLLLVPFVVPFLALRRQPERPSFTS